MVTSESTVLVWGPIDPYRPRNSAVRSGERSEFILSYQKDWRRRWIGDPEYNS